MSVDEARRLLLHDAARTAWGADAALVLMEMLPPTGWGDVATRQQLEASDIATRQQLEAVEVRFGQRLETFEERFGQQLETFEARLSRRLEGSEEGLSQRIDAVEVRLETFEERLNRRLEGTEEGLSQRIERVEERLGERLEHGVDSLRLEMRAEFANSQRHLIQWMVATVVATTGIAIGLATAISRFT